MNNNNIKGQMGFDDKHNKSEQMLTKEETLFKVDNDGKAIPEKHPVYIYDRNIDIELIDEANRLMLAEKQKKSTEQVLRQFEAELKTELNNLKKQIDSEKDKEKKKDQLELYTKKNNSMTMEIIKSKLNLANVDNMLLESKEIISELKKEKKTQTVKRYVELVPCTTGEAVYAFEKGKTIEGKDADNSDWVADLITKKVTAPKYSFEDAKQLKPDYKIALKEAIMDASNYKSKSYRDVISEKRLEGRLLEKDIKKKKKISKQD